MSCFENIFKMPLHYTTVTEHEFNLEMAFIFLLTIYFNYLNDLFLNEHCLLITLNYVKLIKGKEREANLIKTSIPS